LSITRTAMVIHSPHAGRAAKLSQALTFLRQAQVELADVLSIATVDGRLDLGTQWRERGIDIVVAAGGDGLVGGLLSHVTASGLPLGILPLGTANDVARSVGIPQDLQRAVEVIACGTSRAIDLGVAHPAEQVLDQTSGRAEAPTTSAVLPLYWLRSTSVLKNKVLTAFLDCTRLQLTASLCVHFQLTATL